jgi:dihydrofolate reductase
MGKLVLTANVSLDGYIEGPNRELDWHCVDEKMLNHFNDYLGAMSVFLMGRVMYELMAAYWPTADQDPSATASTVEYARIWREVPKIVYSKTLEHADWNSTIVREVVPQEVEKLKAQPGGDLSVGGADLVASFMRHGLIDDYRIYVQPIILGAGKPLFPQGADMTALRLTETLTFSTGVVQLRYQKRDS